MDPKPLSILGSIAEHYTRDALDFAARFDILWENQLHKTGRIKSFVDLHMACECALKAHVALGRLNDDPKEVYTSIRRAGHQVAVLGKLAALNEDRSTYDELAARLQEFSVFFRYSLDAYETFFPSYVERHEAKLNYGKTIGNNAWVLEVRSSLDPLLHSANKATAGFVTGDIEAIITHERQMKEFMDGYAR